MKIIHILKGDANPNTMNGVNKVVHHLATEQPRWGVKTEVWGIIAPPHGGYALQSMKKNRLAKFVYMMLFEKPLITGAMHMHAIGTSEIADLNRINNSTIESVSTNPES